MHVFLQSSEKQNAVTATRNLLALLKIKVTRKSIELLADSDDYPSLKSISDGLDNWRIENMGVNLTGEQLSAIPYPAIAQISKHNGHFVVLTELINGNLKYIDPETGLKQEPIEEFEKIWTGVALLVQPNHKSGEENYKWKRRFEIIEQIKGLSALCLVALLLLAVGLYLPVSLWLILSLKITGVVLCSFLLQEQFGVSKYSKAICRLGKNMDCNAVIHSPASVLFGSIHLSELGALYFLGGLISLSISAFTNYSITGLLTILNWIALPYTIFSVYYQWRVVTKWCLLCLAAMAVFWLEFLVLNYHQWLGISQASVLIVILSFSMPLTFWLVFRQGVIDSFRLPNLERRLNRFLRGDRIFQTLLETQPTILMSHLAHPIVVSSESPRVSLIIVSNPTCGPCAAAHFAIEDLLNSFSDKLSVEYRFLVGTSEEKSVSMQMVKHLIALSLSKPIGEVRQALSSWYLTGRNNYYKWSKTHPIEKGPDSKIVDSIIGEQLNWCLQSKVNMTPTIYINNKKLPEEFTVSDLQFQIRNLIERQEATAPELVS